MYMNEPASEKRGEACRRPSARVTVLGAIAIALFSAIFLRLWYLQVLSGDRYRDLANDNRSREVRVQAPRGEVLDRNGKVLVGNRTDLELRLAPTELPPPGPARRSELALLGRVVDMRTAEIKREIAKQLRVAGGVPLTLVDGLGQAKAFYLRENQVRFPGVSVEPVFKREYRQGNLGAHLFGNVGEVTREQLRLPRYDKIEQADVVGQSGIEYTYDPYLRGKAGATRIQVDSLGRPRGRLRGRPARAGDNLRLTIDSDIQRAGEQALGSFGLPGALVAMDVSTGEVLALASAPTFDPSIFTRPITNQRYKALTSRDNDAPLANRAIQGLYPTGSTFKPITAVAALEDGLITPQKIVNDTGVVQVDAIKFKNALGAVFGPINLSDALKVSSDVYFYLLGLDAPAEMGGGVIQDWAMDLGLGEPTGIDLPAEVGGLVPTPSWRNRLFAEGLTDRPWRGGDNINLAVGQGDLQADPLQMAVAYAAIANGGLVLRPHIADRVESATGEVLTEIRPEPQRQLEISASTRKAIIGGLFRASMEEGGTSYGTFGNFPIDVAGKTGTAERGINVPDQSWFVGLAPAQNPRIVVAVTIERGGFGADSAAPVAARILERYFRIKRVRPVPVPADKATLE